MRECASIGEEWKGGYCWEKVEYLPLIGFFIGVAALYPRMLGSLAYVS